MRWREITGDQLADVLIAAGWQVVGERTGLYRRLAIVDGTSKRHMFMVPLDPSMGDYEDLMDAVAFTLERLYFDGQEAHRVLSRIDPELYR